MAEIDERAVVVDRLDDVVGRHPEVALLLGVVRVVGNPSILGGKVDGVAGLVHDVLRLHRDISHTGCQSAGYLDSRRRGDLARVVANLELIVAVVDDPLRCPLDPRRRDPGRRRLD